MGSESVGLDPGGQSQGQSEKGCQVSQSTSSCMNCSSRAIRVHRTDQRFRCEIDALMEMFAGRALLIIHHMKKLAAEIEKPDPVQSIRGSSYITGVADAVWYPTAAIRS